jgi:2'-5' RNA ligase
MPELTAVDLLVEPDDAAIERARAVNRRMPLSIAAGLTLDDTHRPHITLLQRYLVTAALDEAFAAVAEVLAATDPSALSYRVAGITYSEHWGPPGQAVAVLGVEPSQQVLDLQAALVAAVAPFTGTGGTDAAFVRDAGEQISRTTTDWVENYVPDQTGERYTAHLTVGMDTVEHLQQLQAEPFEAFDVHPLDLAVYQLGNNGTARLRLASWPLVGR